MHLKERLQKNMLIDASIVFLYYKLLQTTSLISKNVVK